MKIVEFRIFVPLKFEQCRTAAIYSVNKRMHQETGGGDGFEIAENEPYNDGEVPGFHVHRILHFKSRVPAAVRWAIPERYAHVHEHNYDCFPHVWGDWYCEGMGKDMILTTETRYYPVPEDLSIPDNIMNIPPEDLEQRKVYYLDILNGPFKKQEFDLHGFTCPEAGIQEMTATEPADDSKIPSWVHNYHGPMTLVVKYLRFMFHWRGLQTTVESIVANTFYTTYLETHMALVKWAPDWSQKSDEELINSTAELKESSSKVQFDKD